jgi:hypothetical protein
LYANMSSHSQQYGTRKHNMSWWLPRLSPFFKRCAIVSVVWCVHARGCSGNLAPAFEFYLLSPGLNPRDPEPNRDADGVSSELQD